MCRTSFAGPKSSSILEEINKERINETIDGIEVLCKSGNIKGHKNGLAML